MKPTPIIEKRPTKLAEILYTEYGERRLKITCPFNHTDLIHIKSLPGKKYHDKCFQYWTADYCLNSIKNLYEWGFVLDKYLQSYLDTWTSQLRQLKPIDVPGLKGSLFKYQNIAVSFIEHHNGNALVADEMGLGKTVETLAWVQLHPEKRPVIIVTPASLKLNWQKEAVDWIQNPKVQIIHGGSTSIKLHGEIFIINYDVLKSWVKRLLKLNPKVLITDESHYYKNPKALRTKAVMKLGRGIPHVIALSGTPIINRPLEIYNAVSLVKPDLFNNVWQFKHRYCGAKKTPWGWNFNGSSNAYELHKILTESIMIRRLKCDVLQELPEKRYAFIPLEMDNEKEYQEAKSDFLGYVEKTKGSEAALKASAAETLVKINTLKHLAATGKMPQAIEWIQDFLNGGGKLVVFAIRTEIIDTICAAFPDITVKVDGRDSLKKRNKAVESFQKDTSIRLFVGNIQAAGVGLTLTAASNVIFLELPWTPGELAQAIDRLHRIGQKFIVFVRFLLAANTIEQDIGELIDKKRSVLNKILDGVETESSSLLTDLMNKYKPTA